MDISRRRNSQRSEEDPQLLIVVIVLVWLTILVFRSKIPNPEKQLATILLVLIAVCSNPRNIRQISRDQLDIVEDMIISRMIWMLRILLIRKNQQGTLAIAA